MFFINLSYGQTWFQDGDTWIYRYSHGQSGTDGYTEVTVDGDTLINGLIVKKLKTFTKTFSLQSNSGYEYGGVRYAYQDEGKIYVSNYEGELADFADFNLLDGDTYEYQAQVFAGCEENSELDVDSIGTFLLDETELQVQYLSTYQADWDHTFSVVMYERIGALDGRILAPYIPCLFDGDSYRLCQFETATDSIRFIDQDCYYVLSSLKESDLAKNILVSPNPTSSKIIIKYDDTPDLIQVFSMNGALLLESENAKEIEVEQLSEGIYFMTIIIGKSKVTKRFIKV